jgi:hypothetical protein
MKDKGNRKSLLMLDSFRHYKRFHNQEMYTLKENSFSGDEIQKSIFIQNATVFKQFQSNTSVGN